MTLLQIVNGTIDPGWVIAILMVVLGALLVRILNRIEKKIDAHEVRIAEHDTEIEVLKSRVKA